MSLTEEDFKCSICFEILLEPTTLTCGHSCCRFCLAQWWITSRKSNCPECREVWQGLPKVNVTLRNTVNSLFGDIVEIRKTSLINNQNYHETIAKFEQLKKEKNERVGIWRYGYLFAAVVVAVFVIIFVGIQSFKGTSRNDLMLKSIYDWSPEDVGYWFGELGPWAKGTFDKKIIEAGIDGSLLMKLTDADLQDFKMNISLHRRITLEAIKKLKKELQNQQTGLWEFKERRSGLAIFIMFGLREFPRSTLTYLYFFNYRDAFLPIFYCSVTLKSANISCTQMQHSPTFGNYLEFLPLMFSIPYYLVGRFASHYLYINYWASRVVILHAVLMTVTEISNMRLLLIHRRSAHYYATKYFIYVLMSSLSIKLLVYFLPVFMTDCIFYWLLYVSPFDAFNRLLKRFFVRNAPHNFDHEEHNHAGVEQQWGFNFQWHARRY
ncbi:bifunctional apoptosis regulator isoform X1 [Hydra vulgaris]|uniref:bifunctional apoptosis regulator isoform X1 n=1 Tax=Hydra vulgaris TaxID=6087 RepID=UPI001F5E8482|nr:bifunctional apoptosis regulator isoform X1 [Hydra vulgaris]